MLSAQQIRAIQDLDLMRFLAVTRFKLFAVLNCQVKVCHKRQ
ncbi:hypothetical protein KQCUZIGB_CDS0030 [Pectobacterium phage Ymer]|uniref:Uncharacterized protein n=4 Tax=unclassified Caudoviricetes TaxID=2788787 RepID=A0AB39ABF6_9CAUD